MLAAMSRKRRARTRARSDGDRPARRRWSLGRIGNLIGMGAVIAGFLFMGWHLLVAPRPPVRRGPPPRAATDRPMPSGKGEAWEYDSEFDAYWHPGHGHWHAGRPPDPAQRVP